MKLFSDPRTRRELLLLGAVGLILVLAGLILSPLLSAGILVGVLASELVYVLLIRRRSLEMERLSQSLSEILRDGDLRLDTYQEGELAILSCELQKLLTALRNSNSALTKERAMLADSLADISHQLRTPLTSMELIVTLLRSPATEEERRKALLSDLSRLLDRTVWLIEALLKLSRLDAGMVRLQPRLLALPDLLSKAAEPLAVALELRNQALFLDIPQTEVRCDPQWTVEALSNLLKNAMEHTPSGGWIRVEAQPGAIYTQLTILDNGPGFDPSDLPYIFDRFYRGKNAESGSFGIGLALTRRILSEENCTIKASNHPEGGALFTLRFYHSIV